MRVSEGEWKVSREQVVLKRHDRPRDLGADFSLFELLRVQLQQADDFAAKRQDLKSHQAQHDELQDITRVARTGNPGMRNDSEKDAVEVNYVVGYPSLAAFIARDPDHSTAIYRRFDRLSARNLLHLQAELATLEKRQDELDKQDLMSDELDAKEKARNWDTLLARAESGRDDEAEERVKTAKAIREKIKEYSECWEL